MFNSYMQICTTTWNISFRRKGEEESVLKPWKRDKKKEEKSRLSSPSKQKYYQNHSSTTRIQDRLSFFLAGMHPAVSYEKVGRGDCFFSGRGSVNKGASARCTVAKGWNRGGCSVACYAVWRTIYIYIVLASVLICGITIADNRQHTASLLVVRHYERRCY